MKSLELEDMKLILKTEVKKSIDHSHHVHLVTNEFDESSKFDSLKTITKREEKFRRVVIDDLSGYEKELDSKLEGILTTDTERRKVYLQNTNTNLNKRC